MLSTDVYNYRHSRYVKYGGKYIINLHIDYLRNFEFAPVLVSVFKISASKLKM